MFFLLGSSSPAARAARENSAEFLFYKITGGHSRPRINHDDFFAQPIRWGLLLRKTLLKIGKSGHTELLCSVISVSPVLKPRMAQQLDSISDAIRAPRIAPKSTPCH
jgi:hypothetical protein